MTAIRDVTPAQPYAHNQVICFNGSNFFFFFHTYSPSMHLFKKSNKKLNIVEIKAAVISSYFSIYKHLQKTKINIKRICLRFMH